MVCPHCGHENVEGRKYCRGCAKPLHPEEAAPKPVAPKLATSRLAQPKSADPVFVSTPAPVNPTESSVHGAGHSFDPDSGQGTFIPSVSIHPMATACLALSFLAMILPVGIAAVVMGHVSRAQIAKHRGRYTGDWLAFAGLLISYLQLAFVSLILFSAGSTLNRMSIAINRDDVAREAILSQFKFFTPKPHLEAARQRQDAKSALRLIGASESELFSGRPDRKYSCDFPSLGWDTRDNELNLTIARSHYSIKIDDCGGIDRAAYSATAIPWADSNPANAPSFCIDQTGLLRRYPPEMVNALNHALLHDHLPCPESGEVVQ